MIRIYFLSGANGVGKSSIIPYLKSLLPADSFAVFDFDARGVPEDADRNWRISETKHWISEGRRLASEDMSTIICGFIKPTDIREYDLANVEQPKIELILLDAEPEIIRQRLTGRYTNDGIFDASQKVIGKPIEEFISGNVWYCGKMREEFEKAGYPIIDTSLLSPEEVAKKVADLVLSKIE
jgi:thymidylate kinase